VHRSAAQWFHEHDMFEEAIHHAIAARDYGFATDTMNQWCDRLIADANLATVERWSDALPLDEIAKRPDLAVKIAWALIFLRRHHKLRPILETLDRKADGAPDTRIVRTMLAIVLDDMPRAFSIIEQADILGKSPSGFRAFELGAAANASGYRALCAADFETAREHLAAARSYNTRGEAAFSRGYTVAVLGICLLMQGRLTEALTRYQAAMAEQQLDLDKSVASASMVSCYVQALYETNQLNLAESLFTQFHDLIMDAVLLDFLAAGYVAMARIHTAHGRVDRAEEVLSEMDEIAHTAGWPRLSRITGWERVRRALLAGEIDRARALASRIPVQTEFELPAGWMIFSEAVEGDSIGRIRLALHSGDLDEASTRLATELEQAQRQGRVYRQIKLLLLDTLLQQRRQALNPARRSLHRALQLAAPNHFVRLFLDEGEQLLPLLRDEHQALSGDSNPSTETAQLRDFSAAILQAAGQHTDLAARVPGDTGFQPLEPLTDREKQILVYLANGVSNKEMARRIFVSENTVKFHLKNIYSKLAVGSRLQAINAARQMGLL
jgi:LuxR family transcriptional regulator, maltose regulon positive regulatory protein